MKVTIEQYLYMDHNAYKEMIKNKRKAINITILPSLIKYIPILCKHQRIGILNFVNNGLISLNTILEKYYSKFNLIKDWTLINTNNNKKINLDTSLLKSYIDNVENSDDFSQYI